MGYKVLDAPVCYNGVPLAKTLTLQGHQLHSRHNRGIVPFSIADLLTGLKTVFTQTPKILTVLCMIVAVLGTCLYGVYLLNMWQLRLQKEADQERDRQRRKTAVNERRRLRKEERLRKELEDKKEQLKK